ncbi:hypothetical protein EfmAA290_19900 [Enterococcus faecium]|nr:hypothetical protein EfmAA290_19900 [Enterococcus faecium]
MYMLKWLVITAILGVFMGSLSAFFLNSLTFVTDIRLAHPWLLYLLPISGALKYVDAAMQYIWITSGTIVVSVLTSMITPFVLRFFDIKWQIWINGINLFGGSVGREGTAVQMGER